MSSNSTIKEELLALFPDNTSFQITASDIRSQIEGIFSSKEESIVKVDTIQNLPTKNANIYEGSLVVIYNDTDTENGIYLAKINQPILKTDLIKL